MEGWLAKVVEGMQSTMRAIIKRANRNVNEQKLDEFLFGHPAQIALLGIQFQWTADTQVGLPTHTAMMGEGGDLFCRRR